MRRGIVVAVVLLAWLSGAPALATPISITSNFNGTAIGTNWIWFNSHLSGVPAVGADYHLFFRNATVTVVDGAHSLVIDIPDATLTFSALAANPAVAGTSGGAWATTYRDGSGNDPFIAGLGFHWNQAWDPNGSNPVTWAADVFTDSPALAGKTFSWQWSASVYTAFSGDISLVGATALDGALGFSQSGSPSNFDDYLIGGARGGGGSNFTGSNSGTGSFTPELTPVPEPASLVLVATGLVAGLRWRLKRR